MAIQSKWLVSVPVATLWTSNESARDLDKDAVSQPADIESWLKVLTYETSLELCDNNLVQSQVLFGQEVFPIEEKGEWMHVIVPDQSSSKDERGYPGWIPKEQIVERQDWKIEQGPVAVVTHKKASLYSESKEPLLVLSYQTILPVMSSDEEWILVQTPKEEGFLKKEEVSIYESLNDIFKGNGNAIVAAGEQFLHLPYLWGGMSSFGYDCSGFSYSMCKANGYIIPRDAHDQANAGEKVELEEIKPGDLLFFAYEEGKGSLHHVGIYYGEGKMLHSPHTGKNIEIIDLKGTIYEKELCAARRYWQEMEE